MEHAQIPVLDLRAEIDSLWTELTGAVAGVLRSGHFIMGPNVAALEREVAEFLGVRHAVALNSGTDARLSELPGLRLCETLPAAEHVYHQYTVRILGGRRDKVQRSLEAEGIQTAVYYPVPLHRLPMHASEGLVRPMAEAAAMEVLSLPIWPQMSDGVQDRVIAALHAALDAS